MRRIIAIVVVVIAIFQVVKAQSVTAFAENMNVYHQGETSPNVFMQANKYYKDSHYGMFTYALAGQYYGEAVAGPTYTLSLGKRIMTEIGIGIGLETANQPLRYAAYTYAEYKLDTTSSSNKGKLSFLINGEIGGSGYWYVGFISYNVSNRLSLGVHAQYGAACGPRLQLTLPGNLLIWATAGYDLENQKPGAVSGLRIIF
jgi:hypothetical protein